jgi:hypothetical protein
VAAPTLPEKHLLEVQRPARSRCGEREKKIGRRVPKKEIRQIGAGALKRVKAEMGRNAKSGERWEEKRRSKEGKLQRGGEREREKTNERRNAKRKRSRRPKKNAPPTGPNAVARKLWLVRSIHPHPELDIQPVVPPMPMPPMLGSGHHSF